MKPLALLPLAFALLFAAPLRAADIVALCIGNDRYAKPEDVLDTPVADARLMKRTLEALPGGADVVLLEDASREDTIIALNSLAQRARGAKLVLVYYSGHGLEGQPDGYAKADTFLLPVEAEIPDVNYLPTRAVGVQTVLEALGKCPVTARAVVLDCCRDGAPKATAALKGATKSFGDIDEAVKAALGAAAVPEATLVAFAAGPGRKAAAFLRQNDANSPFTFFLSESLATGAGNLRDLVEAAAEKTEVATGRRQVPHVTYTGAASAIRQIVWREAVPPPAMSEAEIERRAQEKAVKIAEEKASEEARRKAAMATTTPASAPSAPSEQSVPMAATTATAMAGKSIIGSPGFDLIEPAATTMVGESALTVAKADQNNRPPAAFLAPSLDDHSLGKARDLAAAFLRAPDWETRANYTYQSDRLRPVIDAYHQRSPYRPFDRYSLQLYHLETNPSVGGPYWVFIVSTGDDDEGFPLIVRTEDGNLKVDWESFVEFHDRHFLRFRNGEIAPPATFRLIIERVSDYYGSDRDAFKDLGDHYGYQVNPPYGGLNEFAEHVFVRKDSALAGKLDELVKLGDEPLAVIVTLDRKPFAHGVEHLVATDIIEGWFR